MARTPSGKPASVSLSETVRSRLEEDILSGRCAAGESLTECGIAEAMGVSRTPVREALRQLEREGLVDVVPNKGATVIGLTDEDIRDIGEIRTKMEGIAARRAAVSLTEAQLNALELLLEAEARHTRDIEPEELVRLDTRFHEIIFEASASRLIGRTLRAFHHTIRQARSLSLGGMTRAGRTLEEHRALLEALRERAPDKAEQLMIQHVRNATRNIRRLQQRKDR